MIHIARNRNLGVHFKSLESESNAESKAGLTLHGASEPILMFCSQVAQTGIVTSMCQKEKKHINLETDLQFDRFNHSSFTCGNKSDMTKSKQTNISGALQSTGSI